MSNSNYVCMVRIGIKKPWKYVIGFYATKNSITLIFSDDPQPVSKNVCELVHAMIPNLNITPYSNWCVRSFSYGKFLNDQHSSSKEDSDHD